MRRRRAPITLASDVQLGLAWYRREYWARLREIADDRDALDDSFEDWERNALAAIGELESAGRTVRKAPIDIDALIAWCGERRRVLDSAVRAGYVGELLQGAKRD